MKKLILTALSSLGLLTVSSQAYSMPMNDNMMSGNSSHMMNMKMTENDFYSHLNNQDKAMYDKLDAQQRAFVLRMVNTEMHLMQQKMMNGHEMMNGQGQMQQDRGMNMNRGKMQQDQGMYN
ncbi:MAG: hypothetical protein H0W50_04550 [Parachlamydiaceae bacterium]|nr:hypothetical protein [Parachlamydiaceae bacterium]